MKIHVNLQEINDVNAGIGVVERAYVKELEKMPDIDLRGGISVLRNFDKNAYRRFRFPIIRSRIPARFIFEYQTEQKTFIKKIMRHVSYNQLFRDDSQIFIFFSYRIPIIPVHGKVIAFIHDLIPFKTEMENKMLVSSYKKNLERVLERADLVITVSENSKTDIINTFHVEDHKIRVIYNGISDTYQKKISLSKIKYVKQKYGLDSHYILYFGSCRPYKNVETLVKAYAALPDEVKNQYKLAISNASADIIKMIDYYKISQRVCILENVSDDEKIVIYKEATVFVFISLYEGFGLPILEAMAAGIPVITSDTSSLPEVAGDAAILVNPMDVNQIAIKLENVIRNEKLKSELVCKGYENIKRFSWKKSADNLKSLLDEIDRE